MYQVFFCVWSASLAAPSREYCRKSHSENIWKRISYLLIAGSLLSATEFSRSLTKMTYQSLPYVIPKERTRCDYPKLLNISAPEAPSSNTSGQVVVDLRLAWIYNFYDSYCPPATRLCINEKASWKYDLHLIWNMLIKNMKLITLLVIFNMSTKLFFLIIPNNQFLFYNYIIT